MRNFFDLPTTHWPRLSGCLHLYAWPEAEAPVRQHFSRMAKALQAFPGLGLQPEPFMHVTLQRFDAFESDLQSPAWARLLEVLPGVLEAHRPIALEFSPPRSMSHAVEALGEATSAWKSLLVDLRATVDDCGLGGSLTQPPAVPHFTVAYALESVDDALVDSALQPAAIPTGFELNRVSLVSVEQNRQAGMFSFAPVASWRLGLRTRPVEDANR